MLIGVIVPSAFFLANARWLPERTKIESEFLERRQHAPLGRIDGKPSCLNADIRQQHLIRLLSEGVLTESLQMKSNGRLHVSESFFDRIPVANDCPIQADWICHVTVRVPFDNYLKAVDG